MLRYEGPLGRLFGHMAMSTLKGVGQTALGLGEGVIGKAAESSALSRLAGRAIGSTARLAGAKAYSFGAPMAVSAAKSAYRMGTATARTGLKTAKLGRDVLTKGGNQRDWGNLWTGREWRTGAILAGEASIVGIPVVAGMRAVSQANAFGTTYGSPQGSAPPALAYDGSLNASGDLTLALSRNRHG